LCEDRVGVGFVHLVEYEVGDAVDDFEVCCVELIVDYKECFVNLYIVVECGYVDEVIELWCMWFVLIDVL